MFCIVCSRGKKILIKLRFGGVTMKGLARYLYTALLSVAIVFIVSSSQAIGEEISDSTDLSYWKPHLIYLHSKQCQRLYVEIDTVEDCEPDAGTIESLQQFLKQYV